MITTALILIGGYVYLKQRFSPPGNYLSVSGEVRDVSVRWIHDGENSYSALLVPVKITGIDRTFFMQLDSGSPVTVFYKTSLQSIYGNSAKVGWKIMDPIRVALTFTIKDLRITSDHFKLIDYGNKIGLNDPDTVNIIGTIGTDLLEKRIIILDFRNNLCSFMEAVDEVGFSAFKFSKRRVLLPAKLGDQNIQLLYDSGSSGYGLITDKATWDRFRIPKGKIKTEKGNSWGKELQVISAPADEKIKIAGNDFTLKEITHITGMSKIQILLMQSSGMNGMTGNSLFLNSKMTLDCRNEKFRIEQYNNTRP